jgi:F420H(2)-dependent quinone reductase
MALTGEDALSPEGWVREQTEKILETGTTEGVQVFDRPIVLVTIRGVKSGKLRYTPLMRVEHDGRYALVASKGGAPEHPTWYHNLVAHPHVELQDGTVKKEYDARQVEGDERAHGGSARWRPTRPTRSTRRRPTARSRCSCWSRGKAEDVWVGGKAVEGYPRLLTVTEYLALGEVEPGYTELFEGRVLLTPTPGVQHAQAFTGLWSQLRPQLPAGFEGITAAVGPGVSARRRRRVRRPRGGHRRVPDP